MPTNTAYQHTLKMSILFSGFGFQRFLVRVCILLAMIGVCECTPSFINLVALIGCSTVIIATFVLPSLFYLRLCAQESATWPDRYILLYMVFLIQYNYPIIASQQYIVTIPLFRGQQFTHLN